MDDGLRRSGAATLTFARRLAAGSFGLALSAIVASLAVAQVGGGGAATGPEIVRVRLGDLDGSAAIGPEEAPVTIVAFLDYECPFCAKAHATLEEVRTTFGDDVRIVFKQTPLEFHEQADLAAQAALAAMVLGRFEEMHALLFERQKDLSREDLTEIAVAAGVDREAFDRALDSGDFSEDIARDRELAKRIGVSSTPYFFVNGRPVRGAQPFSAFEGFIRQELSGEPGPTRWVDALEPVASRGDARAEPAEADRTRAFLQSIADAKSPEAANTLLLRQIAKMDRELVELREEVQELRRALAVVAGAERRRSSVTARTEAARDRIVTVGDVSLDDDPARGAEDAPIGIVAFGDFACPYTRKFVRYVLPTLRERWIDGGQARFIFRDRPLPENARSTEAAIAANCAGAQDKYWEMFDALFALDGTLESVDFSSLAESLGLDVGDFRECVADPARADEVVADVEAADDSRLGLHVVPTIFIGRIDGDRLVGAKRVSGVQTVRVLGAVIEAVLANPSR